MQVRTKTTLTTCCFLKCIVGECFIMDKKFIISVIAVLILLLVVVVSYTGENPHAVDKSGEKMSFNVSSGSSTLTSFIQTVKTKAYYEGYDVETVKWMESLGDKRVFSGNDSIVIMDSAEAGKIPQDPGITDVYIYDHFSGEVIEKHKLTDKCPMIYYVKNVEFIEQEIVGNGLA